MSVEALRWAKTQKPKNATQRAVLMAVAEYANEQGLGWPSQKTLADDMLLTDRTIRTALAGLEADGLLVRISKRNPDGTRGVDRIQLCLTAELRDQALARIQRKKLPVARPAENNDRTTGNSFQNHRKLTTAPPEAVSGQEPSLGEPPVGIPHKQNGSEAIASGSTALAVLPVNLSPRDRLWFEGRPMLMECSLSFKNAGDMIGRWLGKYRDPEAILEAISRAHAEHSQAPIGFVVALLEAPDRKARAAPSGKRGFFAAELARDLSKEWVQ